VISSTKNLSGEDDLCQLALAASLFNAGLLREMSGEDQQARKLFHSSLNQFKAIHHPDGIYENEKALNRLNEANS